MRFFAMMNESRSLMEKYRIYYKTDETKSYSEVTNEYLNLNFDENDSILIKVVYPDQALTNNNEMIKKHSVNRFHFHKLLQKVRNTIN